MPPAKRPAVRNVFLSSTAKDLGLYRDAAFKAILSLGFHCVRMEDFGARDWAADDFCRARVAECDVFIGLIGHLYGSSPPKSKTSFTEREYEAAVAAGLPRLLFLAADDLPMPQTLREKDSVWKLQRRFRDRVSKDRIVAFFNAPDPLAKEVVTALHHLKPVQEEISAVAPTDFTQATETYLKFLVDRYQYLDFKGFGVSDRVPLKLPLLEMYVPLKARVETPEGETWDRLRLAGRRPGRVAAAGRLEPNPKPRRSYPWGDEPDPERANQADITIGEPSTVGCFPRGASPYGCEELSGNVWEWTRSLEEPYPYPAEMDRSLREDCEDGGLRVVRGGAFDYPSRLVSCACRRRSSPDYRGVHVGFRVVLSPFSSDL